ncbi:hypothetical protein EON81_14815 [bacterium]|nr:MAG: hypothetical protein EON81_14815 [bacterium]
MLALIALLSLHQEPPKRLLMVHTMPWYEAKPVSKEWGWHWTMGKLDPDKGEVASHYRPLIGLYDSGDPFAVECQILLMKFAGIDGVFVDWYGDREQYDYLPNHRHTALIFEAAKRAGLKFALVYEDQTVPQLVKGGRFEEKDAVEEGRLLMERTQKTWFRSPVYLKKDGKPVLLVFGPQYYKEEAQWQRMFEPLDPKPAFFTLHHRRLDTALGAYDWPLPEGGNEAAAEKRARFAKESKEWPASIPVAYPRFHDFYKEAGLHDSYGKVEDSDGKTYETTLTEALSTPSDIVQIATWNDYGEGTQIEPTEQLGYRDLETTQRLRRRHLGAMPYSPSDLRLPVRLYKLRKAGVDAAKTKAISDLLFAGKLKEAAKRLSALENR